MRLKHVLALLAQQMLLLFGIFLLLALPGLHALPAFADSPSFVRIIHASPDVGTADIFVDGAKLLSSMPFGKFTDYAQLPAGTHKVQIALIGKGPGAAVISQSLSVEAGVAYTVAATGTNATGLSLQAFVDDNLISSGMAKVRVYHLSPGTGLVNLVSGSDTVIRNLPYPHASDYITLPAGSYTFNLTATQPAITLPVATTLKENTVTSIFTIGVFNGNPRLQFVSTQVSGLPGLPGTGSDPYARPSNTQPPTPLLPWLLGIVALVTISASLAVRRRTLARQQTLDRSHM